MASRDFLESPEPEPDPETELESRFASQRLFNYNDLKSPTPELEPDDNFESLVANQEPSNYTDPSSSSPSPKSSPGPSLEPEETKLETDTESCSTEQRSMEVTDLPFPYPLPKSSPEPEAKFEAKHKQIDNIPTHAKSPNSPTDLPKLASANPEYHYHRRPRLQRRDSSSVRSRSFSPGEPVAAYRTYPNGRAGKMVLGYIYAPDPHDYHYETGSLFEEMDADEVDDYHKLFPNAPQIVDPAWKGRGHPGMTVKEPAPVVKLICCTRITPRRREKEDGDLDTEQTAIILGFVEAWKNGGVKITDQQPSPERLLALTDLVQVNLHGSSMRAEVEKGTWVFAPTSPTVIGNPISGYTLVKQTAERVEHENCVSFGCSHHRRLYRFSTHTVKWSEDGATATTGSKELDELLQIPI